MKEEFLSAISDMKKIDGLELSVRENNATLSELKKTQFGLRKENGKFKNSENDLKITELNKERARLEKRNKDIKTEIKALRQSVVNVMSVAYAENTDKTARKRINEGVLHATDGRLTLVDEKDAGIENCIVVEKIKTRIKENKGLVAELKKAGVKNEVGRITVLPEIVLYDYDTTSLEGQRYKVERKIPEKKEIKKPIKQKPSKKVKTGKGFFVKISSAYFTGALSPIFALLGLAVGRACSLCIDSGNDLMKIFCFVLNGLIALLSLALTVKSFKGNFYKKAHGGIIFAVALLFVAFIDGDKILKIISMSLSGLISLVFGIIGVVKGNERTNR